MITPKNIDHICLSVSNIKKTMSHLQSIFDFEFKPHPNNKNTIMVESKNVHFFIQKSNSPTSFLSQQHISFEIKNLKEIKDKLTKLNIKYESGKFSSFKYKNYEWVEWRDHDGIRLECVKIN